MLVLTHPPSFPVAILVMIRVPMGKSEYSLSDDADFSYAYMSDAQSVPYGRARPGTASDKSTTYVETGMFQLSGVGLRKLVPVWVNVDGTVVPNQKFGLDSSNNLIMYGKLKFHSKSPCPVVSNADNQDHNPPSIRLTVELSPKL